MADNNNFKQILVKSILQFFTEELNDLEEEQRESIEVAIQCIEAAYNTSNRGEELSPVDLIELVRNARNQGSDPLVAEQHKLAGNNAMKRGDYQTALTEYTLAIQNNPNNAIYYCNRAAAYTRLDRNDDSIRDCNAAIRLDPNYGKAYGRLGIAYSNMGMFNEARTSYERAIQLEPNNPVYQQNLLIAQQQLGLQAQQQQQQPQPQAAEAACAAGPAAGEPNRMMEFLNNPGLIEMASQMMNTPEFSRMMANLVNSPGAPNIDVLMQIGSALANHLHQSGASETFRNRFTVTNQEPVTPTEPSVLATGDQQMDEEVEEEDDEEESDD